MDAYAYAFYYLKGWSLKLIIRDRSIAFEDEAGAEDLTDKTGAIELGLGADLLQDTKIDQETDPDDLEYDGARAIDDTIRTLEEDELPAEEEPTPGAMVTRVQTNPDHFRVEQDAERYAEYVAMGWRDVAGECALGP